MKLLRSLYFNNLFFGVIAVDVVLFILGFSMPLFYITAKLIFFSIVLLLLLDILLLYRMRRGWTGIEADRICADRLSNGDENPIRIPVFNHYRFAVYLRIIDEAPVQFQLRKLSFYTKLESGGETTIKYSLRPVERGQYHFGAVKIFTSTPIGFIAKRYVFSKEKMVAVYPSYLQMRKYELLAITTQINTAGIKKVRRVGHNMEFDQIREYVAGDDYRTLNWKATARKNNFMVNQYQEEKSQNVYSVIDKGRLMKMPFEGLSLLDYAINASLVISNIAIRKDDRAGLITFNQKMGTILKADKRTFQMRKIQEVLYNQKTAFKESDFEMLYVNLKRVVTQRSLIILYTNFEGFSSMMRQLPYLKKIASDHVLVTVFFENTELKTLLHSVPNSTEEVYKKTIAEKFSYEKRLIVRELNLHGIYTILTAPENLSVNTINKYLELKARGVI